MIADLRGASRGAAAPSRRPPCVSARRLRAPPRRRSWPPRSSAAPSRTTCLPRDRWSGRVRRGPRQLGSSALPDGNECRIAPRRGFGRHGWPCRHTPPGRSDGGIGAWPAEPELDRLRAAIGLPGMALRRSGPRSPFSRRACRADGRIRGTARAHRGPDSRRKLIFRHVMKGDPPGPPCPRCRTGPTPRRPHRIRR